MQNEIIKDEYTAKDWDTAVYLIERGYIRRDHADKYDDIRETAINLNNVRIRSYDEYIKNGGKPAFEKKHKMDLLNSIKE